MVQVCINSTIEVLLKEKKDEEADNLRLATVHWFRHTGISEDVLTRPLAHVRDDAGHQSIATTNRYIDVEAKERYKSAKNKHLKNKEKRYE
jgi:hypothetical protein